MSELEIWSLIGTIGHNKVKLHQLTCLKLISTEGLFFICRLFYSSISRCSSKQSETRFLVVALAPAVVEQVEVTPAPLWLWTRPGVCLCCFMLCLLVVAQTRITAPRETCARRRPETPERSSTATLRPESLHLTGRNSSSCTCTATPRLLVSLEQVILLISQVYEPAFEPSPPHFWPRVTRM